jgi:hypothetical protein
MPGENCDPWQNKGYSILGFFGNKHLKAVYLDQGRGHPGQAVIVARAFLDHLRFSCFAPLVDSLLVGG